MRKQRFYHAANLTVGQTVVLDENNSQQIIKVLRLKPENEILLFNNSPADFKAIIQRINKHAVTVYVVDRVANNSESNCEIVLAQSIAKGQKMDFIIQKAVELGVKAFVPLISERTIVNISTDKIPARLEHWQKIIVGACCQCGRSIIPSIMPPISFKERVAKNQTACQLIMDPLSDVTIAQVPMQNPIHLLVGPEGGFSEDEVLWAMNRGCISVSFGPRILRTETASIVAITALQLQFGDLR